jgi:FAD dependent oxidoreductase
VVRIAVIGGGVFGCTIAVDLARAGAQVDLFEAQGDILGGATARCQARLHRGYHYPRSEATAVAAREGFDAFAVRYPEALRYANGHHYLIASGGKTTADDYLDFCKRLWLPYALTSHPFISRRTIDLVVTVPEAMIDVTMLRRLLRRDLGRVGVPIHTNVQVAGWDEFAADCYGDFDHFVWATYGQPWIKPLQYEICELAIMELGRYAGESFVVLDGDFVSLDWWRDGRFALYDVQHSVHHRSVGTEPEIPGEYAELIRRSNRGPIHSELSHVYEMLNSAGRFLGALDPHGRGVSIHCGSLYSVRAVLPDVDATDERPTLIETRGNATSVLSGKICTAPAAARAVVRKLMPT